MTPTIIKVGNIEYQEMEALISSCILCFPSMLDLFSEPDTKADKINAEKVIYKQISLCLEDVSVTKDVPILKSNAGVTLAILDAVKAIKCNRYAFRDLAYQAAELVIAIWQSYKKAKVPQKWLSRPLQDIFRGLQETLDSMLVFFEQEVSTNILFRMICGPNDMQRINKYHQRLTIILDKFEIQSHIDTNSMLLQLLEKQKKLSSQIQHGNGVKNDVSKPFANKPSGKAKKGASERVSTGVPTTVRAQRTAGSKTAKTAKKPVGKTTRKAGKQTPNLSFQIDGFSEDEDEEMLPSVTPSETRSPMHNFVLPPTFPCDWPWGTDQNFTTAHWTLPTCPSITISSSGKGVTINQGIGNIPYSNFLNVGNGRSMHSYQYRH